MKIYISLPITGKDETKQRQKAKAWQVYFKDRGIETINPFDVYDELRTKSPKEPTYEEIMNEDLKYLDTCSHVILISGWQDSKGCIKEVERSIEKNLTFLFERKIKLT